MRVFLLVTCGSSSHNSTFFPLNIDTCERPKRTMTYQTYKVSRAHSLQHTWSGLPSKSSRPGQSGKCLFAAKPREAMKWRAVYDAPVSQSSRHKSLSSRYVAFTTLVLKIVSFLISSFLSTCSKYARNSLPSG